MSKIFVDIYHMIWTEEKIEELKRLYPNRQNKEISELMNISLPAIRSKSKRLGLTKTKAHKSRMIAKRNKMTGTDITFDLMRQTALKYKTRGEFERLDKSIYSSAMRIGKLDEICIHMVSGSYSIPQLILWFFLKKIFIEYEVQYNSKEVIPPYEIDVYIPKINLAFEYDGKHWHIDNKKDKIKESILFEKGIKLIRIKEQSRDYIRDIKNQLSLFGIELFSIDDIDDCEVYSFVSQQINDLDDIKETISKYSSYSEFIKSERKLYEKLKRRGLLKDLTKGLKKNRSEWNDELVIFEISKYQSLSDFIEGSKGCYQYCMKNGKGHLMQNLSKKYKSYDLDEIKSTIGRYILLYDFRTENPEFYSYLKSKKMLSLTNKLKRRKNRNVDNNI